MPLSLNVLLNAALGGAAAYGGGKRTGQLQKAATLRQQELDRQAKELHESAIAENQAQAARYRHEVEHPEFYHKTETAVPAHEAFRSAVEKYVAEGMSLKEASARARLLYGKNEDDPPAARGPVFGSPEYLKAVDAVEGVRDRHQTGRDTGEAGSVKTETDRREFFQSRIAYHVNMGDSPEAARDKADAEYRAASAGAMWGDTDAGGSSPTARALAHSIPRTGSANAGKRGVKPTETSSTPRHDPTNKNSPRAGALRPHTPEDLDRAIDAVGADPAKVQKWLHDHGMT